MNTEFEFNYRYCWVRIIWPVNAAAVLFLALYDMAGQSPIRGKSVTAQHLPENGNTDFASADSDMFARNELQAPMMIFTASPFAGPPSMYFRNI